MLATVLLSGCLSSETTVALRDDGSGTIDLRYEIDRAAWETGVFDESDAARPIPVTRDDFHEAELLIPGIRLRSHRTGEEGDRIVVEARVLFDSIEALERFFGRGSIVIEMNGASGSWRQVLAQGVSRNGPEAAGSGATGGDASLDALADSLDAYTLRLVLDPPSRVASTNGELLDDGDRAGFERSLGDLVRAREEIVWEVRW